MTWAKRKQSPVREGPTARSHIRRRGPLSFFGRFGDFEVGFDD